MPRRLWDRSSRAFTFGHVRQLDALAARWLVNVAAVAPIASGIDDYAVVDIDDTIKEVHGYRKQGSGYGYSGVRGLNALIGILSTPTAAPVIRGCFIECVRVRSLTRV